MAVETSALVPVSEAVAACLNVPALLDLGVTVYDQIPADKPFPCVAYIVTETQFRSFAQPGKAVELRIHAFTQYEGMRTAQQIVAAIVDLLETAVAGSLAIEGWHFHWADYLGSMPMPDEIINGAITQHLQARWMLIVTEAEIVPPGDQAIGLSTFASTAVLFPPTVALPPVQTVQGATLGSTAALFAPTITLITPSYAETVIADGASFYWRLNETVGTTAVAAVGGVNGTISGGVTLGVASTVGGVTGMTFNGSTAKVVTAAPVPVPVVVTIEGWIKTTSSGQQGFFSTRSSAGAGAVFVGTAAGKIFIYADNPGAGVSSTSAVNNGVWRHVVLVLNGATCTFYRDGVVDGAPALARVIAGTVGTASIGWDESGAGNFTGSVDEVAIYPLALTPTQIATHYARGIS